MRKKAKGFTLIELLAVIVILAIIALIAVPIVLNLIEKARKGAFTRSAEGVLKASQLYYTSSLLEPEEPKDIEFTCVNDKCVTDNGIKLDVEGNVGNGYIKISSTGDIELSLNNGKYAALKTMEEKSITIKNNKELGKDVTPPEIIDIGINTTTNSIEVIVSARDNESGINGYAYSINGGEYTEIKPEPKHVFEDLEKGTYNIKVKVYNGSYGKDGVEEVQSITEYEEKDITLSDFSDITITSLSTAEEVIKKYEISGTTEGATLQYKILFGETIYQDWINYTNILEVDFSLTSEPTMTIYARYNDGKNISEEKQHVETKSDITAPTIELAGYGTTVVSATFTDDISDKIYYKLRANGENFSDEWLEATSGVPINIASYSSTTGTSPTYVNYYMLLIKDEFGNSAGDKYFIAVNNSTVDQSSECFQTCSSNCGKTYCSNNSCSSGMSTCMSSCNDANTSSCPKIFTYIMKKSPTD